MRRLSSVLVAFLITRLFAAPPATSGLDPSKLQLIPIRLQELVDQQVVAGAVALVARHGEIASLNAVGYRERAHKKPMQTDSIFQIMSMTKPFTGVAIMMLVEEGRLELRRPIEDYLPEFKGKLIQETSQATPHPPLAPPTVWQLMCHTSGLESNPEASMATNQQTLHATLAEAVRNYAGSEQPLKFEPGTKWHYSNLGIATLGRIIEVVSHEDYVHFIETRILHPLGMNDSFFFPPAAKKDRISMVYKHENGKLTLSGPDILGGDPTRLREGANYPAPEFGMYSTASDLLKFYTMLLNGGSDRHHRYLSKASLDVMREVHTPDVQPSGWLGGTGYGLTFEIITKPLGTLLLHHLGTFGHGGAFGTEGWMDPVNDLVRIVLVQVSDGSAGAARSVVMQLGEAAVVD